MSNGALLNWADRVGSWFGSAPKEGPDALPVRVHGREYGRTRAAPAGIKAFDQNLAWAIAGLLIWGLVMVYSASIALNDGPRSTGFSQVQYHCRLAGLSNFNGHMGKSCTLGLYCVNRVVDRGATALYGKKYQWCKALDQSRCFQFSTL